MTPGVPAGWFAMIQSMADMKSDQLPEPVQPKTRTGTIVAFLATPNFVPATVPAT